MAYGVPIEKIPFQDGMYPTIERRETTEAAIGYFLSQKHAIPQVEVIMEPGVIEPAEAYCAVSPDEDERTKAETDGHARVYWAFDGRALGAPMMSLSRYAVKISTDHHTPDADLPASCGLTMLDVTDKDSAQYRMMSSGSTVHSIPVESLNVQLNSVDEDATFSAISVKNFPLFQAVYEASDDPYHPFHEAAVGIRERHEEMQYTESSLDSTCAASVIEIAESGRWASVQRIAFITQPYNEAKLHGLFDQNLPSAELAATMESVFEEMERRYLDYVVHGHDNRLEPDMAYEKEITEDDIYIITELSAHWRYKAYLEGCEIYVVKRSESEGGSSYIFGRRDTSVPLDMVRAKEFLNSGEARKRGTPDRPVFGVGHRCGGNLNSLPSLQDEHEIARNVAMAKVAVAS